MCPYKSTIKNLQELLYLLNLQALYTISLYGRDTTNMTAVNILIAMAALQFSIILTLSSTMPNARLMFLLSADIPKYTLLTVS